MEKTPQEHHTGALRCEDGRQRRPQFKGIRERKWGSWGSEIRMPKTRAKIWLGSYKTAEQAARAYDAAAYCLRGSNANFNFPDSVPSIPSAFSLSPRQIKLVASRYARDELPSTSPSLHNNNHDNGVSLASSSRSSVLAETELWNNCEQIHVERGSWVSLFDSSDCLDFQTVPSMDNYSALDSIPTWQEKQDGYISLDLWNF